jgi:hypothetical protein
MYAPDLVYEQCVKLLLSEIESHFEISFSVLADSLDSLYSGDSVHLPNTNCYCHERIQLWHSLAT